VCECVCVCVCVCVCETEREREREREREQEPGCSGSEAGSYVRLIVFVYHSTLGLRVTKKKRRTGQQQRRGVFEPLPIRYRGTSLKRNNHTPRITTGP